jgi:hypothetical protein
MALLDTIKTQLQSPQAPAGTVPGGQTQTVRQLLQAKAGKAIPSASGSPRQSALQEKTAEAQAQASSKQLGLRGQIQAEQLGQQELDITQREQQQEAQFQESWETAQANMNRQANQLLQQFESGQKTLQTTKDMADLEQLGFQLRLQNDQYINQLQDVGRRNRLDNQLEFKKQLAQNVFKDQQELMTNELAFNRMMAADDREFMNELAQMDIGYAMQVADNAAKAASAQQIALGMGGMVSGGLQAASSFGIFNSNSSTSPGASGEANPQPATGGTVNEQY